MDEQKKASEKAAQNMRDMVDQAERWLATMMVMRGLSSLWREMTEYAASYYDAMNEIRIITGDTVEEAERMGASYRRMAQDMSVSSTEIAKAAVEFWRQGLTEAEVNERLRYTTAYAKISALEFDTAAELMTAAANGMGVSADRIADVWSYLGDASASGADELGIAMQKVAASAEMAGVSFEWLGAYIATISEKTRLAPEAVGTALNSMISRLQQIKQQGFNSEDAFGLNDIAKALAQLEKPVAIMDELTGEWRAWPDILNEIAVQWADLDAKTQGYIATTMAGTRQRNYFLTLMEDLALGSEKGSKAWELYEGALNSAGAAMQKYAVWEESVEAAQNRLTAELEEFYSLLSGTAIKNWYDVLAFCMNGINGVTEATGGMNIAVSVSGAAITMLTLLFLKLKTNADLAGVSLGKQVVTALTGVTVTAQGATVATNMLGMALRAAGAGLAIAGVMQLVGWLISLYETADEASKKTSELASTLNQGFAENNSLAKFASEMESLGKKTSYANEDIAAFNRLRSEMIAAFPELAERIGGEVKDVNELAGAYDNMAAAIEEANRQRLYDQWNTAHDGLDSARRTLVSAQRKKSGDRSEQTIIDSAKNVLAQENISMAQARGVFSAYVTGLDALTKKAEVGERMVAELNRQILEGASGLKIKATSVSAVSEALDAYIQRQKEIKDGKLEGWEHTDENIHSANSLRAQIREYDSITSILNNEIKPWIDDLDEEISQDIASAVTTLVTDAVNPYQFSDIPVDILSAMKTALTSHDWGGATANEIREQAEAFVNLYHDEFAAAQKYVNGIRGQELTDELLEEINAYRGTMMKAFAKAGMADMLDELFAPIDSYVAGKTKGKRESGSSDSERSLKDALELLEQMQMIRDAIAEFATEGVLSSDTLSELSESFGEAFSELFAELGDGETWQDRLNTLWENIATDSNMNLLKLFGLNVDDTDAAAEALQEALSDIASAVDTEELAEIWEELPNGIKDSIAKAHPEIVELLERIEAESADAVDGVSKNMQELQKRMEIDAAVKGGKAWEDLADLMADIEESGSAASDAISEVQTRVNEAGEAMGALAAAQAGDADALEHLASITGLTAESLKGNLLPAELAVAQMSDQAGWSVSYLANALYTAGAVEIDPSGKLIAIGSIEAAAAAAGMTVAQFAAALTALNGASFHLEMGADGASAQVKAYVPKINWSGGSSSSRSGGSRGGGGSSSTSVSKAIETMLDKIGSAKAITDYRRELMQLAQAYHESRGELQGVILYLEREREIVKENITSTEQYVAQIEEQIKQKQAVIASSKEGSKAYKQAMADLEALQKDHQEYSKELLENKTDIEELTAAIKEQYNTIREMEIDLRDTILEAIEDRQEREERMLDGRVSMEEEIMDILRERYEKERDEILETQELKRDALQEEIDQIDELLEARKKLAEEEDKLQKVAELEAQIARISADPTRQKEALKLQQELNSLREELAWDAAEKEAEAQKESLEQQITSIEDYMQYVEDYYDELLNNPLKLIAEMQEIIQSTDEEIMNWLKENSKEYAESTEAVQKQMAASWQETLDDMNGAVRTYWEEVEQIIAGGSESILSFLKEHSQDYKEAGKLQAEAYVDEWKKQLDDLEAAYKKVSGDINSYDYTPTTSSGSSGSSGGSGSSKPSVTYYVYQYRDISKGWTDGPKATSPEAAYNAAKAAGINHWKTQAGIGQRT